MFTFNYHYTDEDYLRYNISNLRHSKHGKRAMLRMRILILVCMLMVVWIDALIGQPNDLNYYFFLAIFMGIAFVILQLLLRPYVNFTKKLSIKVAKKDGRLPYPEHGTLTVDDEGIHDFQPDSTALVRWEKITNIDVVIPEGIYVYIGAAQAVIMTNAIFENEAQKGAFIDFAKSKIGAEKIMYYKK